MADQRRIFPLGMVKNLPIRIKDMSFDIDDVVLPKGQTKGQVPMILGRPWLRHNNVRQEWDLTKNFVELVWRGERRRISTIHRCIPNKASIQPIEVCTLNWEDGLSEEEEMMLQWTMPSLWTIAEIDIEHMEPTSNPDLQQGETCFLLVFCCRRQVQFNERTIAPEKEEGEELKYPKTLSWKRTVVEIEDATRAARWLQTLQAKDVLKEKVHSYTIAPEETVKKEIEKLKEADFIYPVKEYDWLSPIVIVPKKNGKLRVCVNYRKLNGFTVKDPYPIPFIDDILDKVAGREAYTFMDGYSGYNQVEIAPEDRKKTAFIIPWGAYAYARMPFGLSNAPATFQRLVIDTFAEYIGDFMEAFLDDFTVYGSANQHLQQLEKALIKCLENQIRLNLEKCVFWVQSGALLGHIICSEGVLMDPGKVEKIRKQPAPTNRKELQRVMGMANFYRRYILNYTVLAAPVNALNKENIVFKWAPQCQEAFDLLKEKLSQGPILRPPNWNMIFHVHTDASGVAVGAVLAQPQDPNIDLPIYFASRTLNKCEKDYTTTEREALAMMYAVKKFKPYLQGNKFIFFVDHQALTYIVNKVHITGRIARWLLLLHEFDFTVVYKLAKINILADQLSRIEMGREIEHEDDSFPDEYLLNINLEKPDTYVSSGDEIDDSRGGETYEGLLKGGWQTPMRYLLTKGSLPEDTPYHIKKKMAQKSAQDTLIEGELYKQGIDQVLRRCVNEKDVPRILEEAHEGPSGGHGAGESTAQKILHTGLWWPTIFKDCHSHVQTCNECRRSATLKEGMPLKPIFPLGVFQKWGLDFIGPIKPASFPIGKRYIITTTDYTTKWVEAECYRTNDKKVTAKFIYENIITRFGVPVELVSDQGGHFLNGVIEELTTHYKVKHRFSTPYYPQCNGQAESTNKILIVVFRKLVERHPVNWDASIPSVLWAMRTTYKATTNHTPFHMVFGVEALVPMEFIVPTLKIATEYNLNLEEMLQRRLKELLQLEESMEQAFAHQCAVQERRKRYVDKRRKMFNFKKDDKVLYCVATGKIKRRKLKYIWEGPYIVQTVLDNGNICIVNDDKSFIQIVNGNKLRPYGVNKFARGDPFVEQVEDILRNIESTAEEYYPEVADDYRIELTPKDMSEEHASDDDTKKGITQHVHIKLMNRNGKDVNCYSISILPEEAQPDDVNVMPWEQLPDGCNSSDMDNEARKEIRHRRDETVNQKEIRHRRDGTELEAVQRFSRRTNSWCPEESAEQTVTMTRKPVNKKKEVARANQNDEVVFGDEAIPNRRVYNCYLKDFVATDCADEDEAVLWMRQFGALPTMNLSHIAPKLITEMVNSFNGLTNRITIGHSTHILNEDLVADVYNVPNEGIKPPRNPILDLGWLQEAYPDYAIGKKGKEYYSAARCEHPEWREKIAWVLRYVLGRAEGQEVSKGVLAAMLESAETGKGVNWAYILTDRLKTELWKLKLARKGEVYKCEAGPHLTVLAEYLATERKLKTGNPAVKPTPKGAEKKKQEEPLKAHVKPSGKKPVTPAKKIKADAKKIKESPSQRTRAAKRKLADDSQDGRRNRKRKVQIEVEESEEQEDTEDTTDPEETEFSDDESGETLPTGTDETSDSSGKSSGDSNGESGEDEQEVTPPYRQPTPQSIPSEDSVEKKERVRNFGGKLLETVTTSSSEDTGGPPGFAPILHALGEAGELNRAQSIPDASLPTDSSSEPDRNKRKGKRGVEIPEVGVGEARQQALGLGRLKKRLKKGERP
ncbi:hypothetical protein R1sor_017597 [Riccia sorocarpa]|uniref:Reverse transcriptase n=1 Tax=Riccia sorocarpa TaxID=122646 RepID=A0ABD3IB02_9MARC